MATEAATIKGLLTNCAHCVAEPDTNCAPDHEPVERVFRVRIVYRSHTEPKQEKPDEKLNESD